MSNQSFVQKSHFKIYDAIIPLFRIITLIILISLLFYYKKSKLDWNLSFVVVYFIYAIILLFFPKLRVLIAWKYPVIIGAFETLIISYGLSITGATHSLLYYSYILVIVFFGIVHKETYLAIVTAFICVCYALVCVMENGFTFYCVYRFLYLIVLAIFIALIHGRTKNYNAKLIEQDQLTGLYNRQYLFSMVEDYIKEPSKEEKKFLLFMIDVNDFKKINDTFGHLEGDKILCDVAYVLKREIGSNGIVARYGGDEFVVFLAGVDSQNAKRIREEIHQAIKDFFANQINLSIGYANYPLHGTDFELLFQLADEEMYKQKMKYKESKKVNKI